MNQLKNSLLLVSCFLLVYAKAQTFQWAKSEPYVSYVTYTDIVVHDALGNCFVGGECKLIYNDKQEQFSKQYFKTIDLSHHPKGVYFIEMLCGNQRKIKKILLQ